jgi:arylsulfatase A-like enzyme
MKILLFYFFLNIIKEVKKPNFVLITIDCFRYDFFIKEVRAQNSRLPFLKKLAQKGILLNNFYANGCWSGSAMPSILSSTYPFADNGRCQLFGRQPTIAQALKKSGYLTFSVNANPYFSSFFGYHLGFDYFCDSITSNNRAVFKLKPQLTDLLRKASRKNIFLKYLNICFRKTILPLISKISPAAKFSFLKAKQMNKIVFSCLDYYYYKSKFKKNPFFLWIHYMDAHQPLYPEKKYLRKKLNLKTIKKINLKIAKREKIKLSQKELINLKELYLASLAQVDEAVKKLYQFIVDELKLKNTFFMITADHGELLTEKKGFYGHGAWLYQELVHIPLFIAGPGIKASENKHLYSQIDLAPTISQIAGIRPPLTWQGKAFLNRDLKIVKPNLAKAVFSEEGCVKAKDHLIGKGFGLKWNKRSFAVIKGRYKYITNLFLKTEEFFDLKNDPQEKRNLIREKSLKPKVDLFKFWLKSH